MKFLSSIFLVVIYGLSSNNNPLHAQPNLSISILTTNVDHVDTAKSIFGLNEIGCTILNTSGSEVKIRVIRSECKNSNTNWLEIPDFSHTLSYAERPSLSSNASINVTIMVQLFNLYLEQSFNIEPLIASGGMVDYRVVYAAYDGNTESVIYTPVIHIVLPAATPQDAAALQYVIQQKSACPEVEYFFAGINMSTHYCNYVYEYLIANFPETLLGKVSKYTMAQRECLLRRAQINALPEVKASIINTRDMLLQSDIPYMKRLARYLDCANN
ncbi:MAG: hypothetical protein JNM22_17270 [Saprospiraceae bacterium]|nr:hypothetical protein [Saprospiraceae bacterium]